MVFLWEYREVLREDAPRLRLNGAFGGGIDRRLSKDVEEDDKISRLCHSSDVHTSDEQRRIRSWSVGGEEV